MDRKNYNIQALSVEIQILKVGKKQCTIAVFKQLKERYIQVGEFEKIEIWGEVNYKNGWYVIYALNGEIFKFNKEGYRESLDLSLSLLGCKFYDIAYFVKEAKKEDRLLSLLYDYAEQHKQLDLQDLLGVVSQHRGIKRDYFTTESFFERLKDNGYLSDTTSLFKWISDSNNYEKDTFKDFDIKDATFVYTEYLVIKVHDKLERHFASFVREKVIEYPNLIPTWIKNIDNIKLIRFLEASYHEDKLKDLPHLFIAV